MMVCYLVEDTRLLLLSFRVDNLGNMLLGNVITYLPDFTAAHQTVILITTVDTTIRLKINNASDELICDRINVAMSN